MFFNKMVYLYHFYTIYVSFIYHFSQKELYLSPTFLKSTMEYSCIFCKHKFKTKDNLLKHLRRKYPCSDVSHEDLQKQVDSLTQKNGNGSLYQCTFCTKKFSHLSGMYRHRTVCKGKAQHNDQLQELNDLRKRVAELEKSKTPTIQNNTTNNGTINNIQINAFGNENTSYITDHPNFKSFMIHCIKTRRDGVCKFLVQKHFNENHPENHNIKKLTRNNEFIDYFDGRTWNFRYNEDVLDDVFGSLQAQFANFVEEELYSEDGKLKKVWVQSFMDEVGAPLEWDLSTMEDEFTPENLSDDKKQALKKKIYDLALEHIYRKSKANQL